jgi:hypothetical protein
MIAGWTDPNHFNKFIERLWWIHSNRIWQVNASVITNLSLEYKFFDPHYW